MKFSRRTHWNTEETALARALAARRRSALPVLDLTASNPTRCGIRYPDDLLEPFESNEILDYNPDPRGLRRAREAVSQYYAMKQVEIDPDRIVLTTGTSEAYSFLFRLLCDPGDEVLVPVPGYPLFDYLADAESVRLVAAPLVYDHGWQLDSAALEAEITARTRAVILVHPNNPTGHFTSSADSEQLFAICERHGLAVIVDEVFLDYPLESACDVASTTSFLDRNAPVPLFVVSGISKILGLPQMKVAWIAASNAATPIMQTAMERLEVLADSFLSVGTPVQVALPRWLPQRDAIQCQIGARVTANLKALDSALASQHVPWVSRLRAEGGWYAILRVPAVLPDEETAALLLERGVWVHPGSFFALPSSGWMVVSLLTPAEEFSAGVQVLLESMAEIAENPA